MHKHPTTSTRPFLKWAGGKQRLLESLLPLLPPGARLIEPFVGAGAVFLASSYPEYVLNDANADLVAVWTALKRSPSDYVRDAAAYFCAANHNQSCYLTLRETFNASSDPYVRATLLPYLNRFGFNGLYRVNRTGAFNVPYGKPARLPVFPVDAAMQAADRLQHAMVLAGDFQGAIDLANAGDIVYCDPPYHPSNSGPSFSAYTSGGFADADHLRLVEGARAAADRGARVFISNHDTPVSRSLYKDFRIHELRVNRSIASTKSGRGMCGELLAVLSPNAPHKARGLKVMALLSSNSYSHLVHRVARFHCVFPAARNYAGTDGNTAWPTGQSTHLRESACSKVRNLGCRRYLYGSDFAALPMVAGSPVVEVETNSMATTTSAPRSNEKCGPIVYLDFDGVLHHEQVLWSPRWGPCLKAPAGHRLFQHAGLLESLLIPYPDVRIVLSTSWVLRYGCMRTARRLPAGLRERIVGATFHSAMDSVEFQSLPRGMQVWADVLRRRPCDWIALDDDYMNWPAWCRDRYVRTDPLEGISPPSVVDAIRQGLRRIASQEDAEPPGTYVDMSRSRINRRG